MIVIMIADTVDLVSSVRKALLREIQLSVCMYVYVCMCESRIVDRGLSFEGLSTDM